MSTILQRVCPKLVLVVEIAAAKWVVASYGGGAVKPRRKVLTQDTAQDRYAALLEELTQARRRLGLDPSTPAWVAYEAGQEGFWLVRALRAQGIEADVIDPGSLQVDRRARRAKTDRLDAEALVASMWSYAQGNHKALRLVRVPSEQAEDLREWQRERDRLMGERQGCLDRIRKKLRSHGIWVLTSTWREQLRSGRLRTFSGAALGPMLQSMLLIELERAQAAETKLKLLEREAPERDPVAAERIERLSQLYGIGRIGARSLALRLFWRQFENRRQVGACTGLVGTPYDSGTIRQDQGISKAGDRRLRAMLVELAWLWLRHQPDSPLTRWFHRRTQGSGKRGKRIMIVAVARRLAIELWRYLQHGAVPAGARFKAA